MNDLDLLDKHLYALRCANEQLLYKSTKPEQQIHLRGVLDGLRQAMEACYYVKNVKFEFEREELEQADKACTPIGVQKEKR